MKGNRSIWMGALVFLSCLGCPFEAAASPFSVHPDAAIEHYRDVVASGGWPALPKGPDLLEGHRDARVPVLRTILTTMGDLTPPSTKTDEKTDDQFDQDLRLAVLRFQERHGLALTGTVDRDTRRALNVPAARRLGQLESNAERWRGWPAEPGPRYVVVNIPDFSLTAVESGRADMKMKVVVGKPGSRTPSFTTIMTQVIFHPYWNVPASIARWELLRKIQRDPGYLKRKGFEVFESSPGKASVVKPSAVDWKKLTPKNLPYRLRQRPGPENALGQIKFTIPNRFNVYLHDTPERELFDKQRRAFSHGCIRLEEPEELARFVLRTDPAWPEASIAVALQSGRHRVVTLIEPLPVYILYWSAWIDADETVQFREDLYRKDKPVSKTVLQAAAISFDDEGCVGI